MPSRFRGHPARGEARCRLAYQYRDAAGDQVQETSDARRTAGRGARRRPSCRRARWTCSAWDAGGGHRSRSRNALTSGSRHTPKRGADDSPKSEAGKRTIALGGKVAEEPWSTGGGRRLLATTSGCFASRRQRSTTRTTPLDHKDKRRVQEGGVRVSRVNAAVAFQGVRETGAEGLEPPTPGFGDRCSAS